MSQIVVRSASLGLLRAVSAMAETRSRPSVSTIAVICRNAAVVAGVVLAQAHAAHQHDGGQADAGQHRELTEGEGKLLVDGVGAVLDARLDDEGEGGGRQSTGRGTHQDAVGETERAHRQGEPDAREQRAEDETHRCRAGHHAAVQTRRHGEACAFQAGREMRGFAFEMAADETVGDDLHAGDEHGRGVDLRLGGLWRLLLGFEALQPRRRRRLGRGARRAGGLHRGRPLHGYAPLRSLRSANACCGLT